MLAHRTRPYDRSQKLGDSICLGMLTPSCNTVLEPITNAIVSQIDGVTAHFSRFRVRTISLEQESLRQFDLAPMLEAADLLADANVDVIAWNGTSGSWVGFEEDENLCRAITEKTGIPATTSALAIRDLLLKANCKKYALLSPYTKDVQDQIIGLFDNAGFMCVAEKHFGQTDGYSYAKFSNIDLTEALKGLEDNRPEASIVMCTNVRAAPLAERLEQEGQPMIVDSISATVWKSLLLAGVNPSEITNWGRLFSVPA